MVPVAVAVLVLAAACSSDSSPPSGASDTSSRGTSIAPGGSSPPGTGPPAPYEFSFVSVEADHLAISTAVGESEIVVFVTLEPFAIATYAYEAREPFLASPSGGGLYVVREGKRHVATTAVARRAERTGVDVAVTFDDGTTGRVTITGETKHNVRVVLTPDDPVGVTAWGYTTATTPDEMIYGLTERIVDDYPDSELLIKEVGSLNRKGEKVTMYVRPTMSGYVPFYQSSKGYGVAVDGTMPGTYDLGATDPSVISMEFELDAQHPTGSFHLLYGPGHAQILDEYTKLTGRPLLPPDEVFTHWRGRDEYPGGATADWHGLTINATVALDLNAYEEHGIPPGIWHWDRPWAVGAEGYGDFVFDEQRFPNATEMLRRMKEAGWKHEVWVAPWAIDAAGEEARAKGFLAPSSPRALDLTNPAAVAWQQDRLVAFLNGPQGQYVDGLFMDRGDEADVTSTAADVYANGETGRAVHNEYPVLYEKAYREAIDRARPNGGGWLIARPAYTGSQQYVMRWGGDTPSRLGITIPEHPSDTPSTDLGLRSVLISMQRAAFMGTAYWGSDIGGYSQWIDPDLYARWIEVGAVSPLMRFHGQGGTPWKMTDGTFSQPTLDIYQRYVGLHHALQPYLVERAKEAHESGLPIVRPLVFAWPDEAGARDRWDEWLLGPDLLAAPVWRSGDRRREVWFPPGRWVDVWDRGVVVEGPVTQVVDAPLDVLPLYAREGAGVLASLATG
jgi:alpha-D-xyloside xylohydrolase